MLLEGGQGCAAAVGDLDAGFEVAVYVHEAPLVFPFFALLVVLDLPRLVKRREPFMRLVYLGQRLL